MSNFIISQQMSQLSKAVSRLREALRDYEGSDIYRDAIIQRFEFCIEYSWKTLKKVLKHFNEDDKLFARELFKKFHENGIIEDIDIWMDFLSLRNQLSHIYNEETAIEAFRYIQINHEAFDRLLKALEKYLKSQDVLP
jgi:nucleotidyltransferase substrate binding protein (TIGR01987 family)